MVAAFASKVRTMAKLSGRAAVRASSPQQFGLAPWQVDRARRDLQGWTDAGLGRAIEILAETDAQVKGGGRDPVFALERMVGSSASRRASNPPAAQDSERPPSPSETGVLGSLSVERTR